MFSRKVASVVIALCLFTAPAWASKVDGVNFADNVRVAGRDLVFNGGGKRTFFGIGVYVAALYLQHKSADGQKIVNGDEPMDVRLKITSLLVTRDNMKSGFLESFKKTATVDPAPLQSKIDAFVACFNGLQNHDVYDFAYIPGKGVQVSRNEKALSLIQGVDFKKALYGIWLGSKPAQSDLKDRMLGR
ncbi:MAG: chalcone isomerase family protein [Syntrophobacteraceae bacterium]|nr:chalcone isomerase family protein [Syntrophobacteraceae bacterium]